MSLTSFAHASIKFTHVGRSASQVDWMTRWESGVKGLRSVVSAPVMKPTGELFSPQ